MIIETGVIFISNRFIPVGFKILPLLPLDSRACFEGQQIILAFLLPCLPL